MSRGPSGPAGLSGHELADLLDAAGLTGRGGAAFRTGVKVRAAHDHGAHLVVNACDGELGAAKDAYVVDRHLDSLLRGAALVAPGRRRRTTFAAHRGSATAARLHAAGVPVLEVPARYVSSEESALVSLANGGLARPLAKRRPIVTGGRHAAGGRVPATVVLNAETVLRVAQVVEHGPEWFRGVGTLDEPGPRLVALSGAVAYPGVLETAAGVTFASLLEACGADPGAEHVVVGGLGGVMLSVAEARSTTWSTPGLAPFGGAPGPGVVIVLDPARCPLTVVSEWLAYAGGESAGQCGPCMFGVPSLASAWEGLVRSPSSVSVDAVRAAAGLLPGRGACRFPDGVARFAGSALRVLSPHLAAHARGGCPTEGAHHVAV
ncbi:NADH-ubiquinone oxidoreductase-F iron-sulfur binding region domain-containing protein [Phycicoccus flavus]|uniref:NADH-ubiquinone oxidoreductase-F iron-sulfur binding region domain-containing protein n=1 Tax=Phycicoccus flavus TaxID=2502783 RepID=UPI000FEB6635|nr:NADH-ubiquinone oxidoreductase-F iron-sulfur binding region domain-containing protein [Phycicoccus flavus]NHA70109.1 formate dehydrogenase [Phycicoccus flavus]